MDTSKGEYKTTIRSIGWVRNELREGCGTGAWLNTRSKIVIDQEYAEALEGIEDYSHVVVVFWMHRVPKALRSRKSMVPPYAPAAVGERGTLATRVPERPNPIGISVVSLVEHRGNVLVVENLDAFDGTPVLDVKPFTGHLLERPKNFRIPEWERYTDQEKS